MIVELSPKSKKTENELPVMDKKKFLTPGDLTIGQFLFILRKRLKLSSTQSLFLFVNNTIPPSSMLLSQLYESQKDADGFLYVEYASESTFG